MAVKQHPNLVDEVESILRAQESAGWMVGDLIVKEMGTQADKVEVYLREDLAVRLEARGLDIEYERLRAYYRVALKDPPEVRNGVSFTAAEEAGDKPERFKWYAKHGASLSKRQVRKLRGDRRLDTAAGSKNASTAEKAAALKELLEDEAALDQALASNPRLRDRLAGAVADPISDEKSERGGGGRRGAEWTDLDRLVEEIDRFGQALTQRYESLAGQLHPDLLGQTRLLESMGRLRNTLDLFESGLTEGLTFEQFLASLSN